MIVEPIPNTELYILCENAVWTYRGIKYTVPKGFKSDGASIPRIFWSLSTTPYHPTVIRAAFFHDYFYQKQPISRRLADQIFYVLLLEDGTSEQVAENMYYAVRDFGGGTWKRYSRRLMEV